MSKRDPRIEPAPGDVLRVRGDTNKQITRKVKEIDGDLVIYTAPTGRILSTFMSQWRTWAQKATIVSQH